MKKDLFIKKQFAEIYEIKGLMENNDNEIRIYCVHFPDVFALQIRTHKPITSPPKGKPRNMIAHIELSISEMHRILQYMEEGINEL